MKLIKAEYNGKSSQGIYANVTFEQKKLFKDSEIITKEVFLDVYNFKTQNYSTLPQWVDTGKILPGINFYQAVAKEIIRQYEKTLNE